MHRGATAFCFKLSALALSKRPAVLLVAWPRPRHITHHRGKKPLGVTTAVPCARTSNFLKPKYRPWRNPLHLKTGLSGAWDPPSPRSYRVFLKASSPSIRVISTSISLIFSSGTARIWSLNTARSASLPTSIDPLISSSKLA